MGFLLAKMSGKERNVILFNGSNWNVWKFQVTVILRANDLYDVVTGVLKKNEGEKPNIEFAKKDSRAQELLVTSIAEGPMTHLLTATTAKEMWDKLCSVYEKQTAVSVHYLQQQFFNVKYEGEGINQFLSNLELITSQLKQNGETVSDKMIITKILLSLKDKFKYFTSAWESVPETEQTLESLRTRLLLEEERENNTEKISNESVALSTTTKGRNIKDRKEIECFYCKKKGHIKKNCWFAQNKNKKQGKPNQQESNVFISYTLFNGAFESNGWYLDSGATEHMTGDKNTIIN